MRENNIEDILNRLSKTLKSSRYINHLNDPVVNWLDIPIEDAINSLLKYIEELSEEKVEIQLMKKYIEELPELYKDIDSSE